jgi:hypothetical protein
MLAQNPLVIGCLAHLVSDRRIFVIDKADSDGFR